MADDLRPSAPPLPGVPEEATRPGSPQPPSELPTGSSQRWGDLVLVAEIGRGASGRVYRAWDPTLAREVALKVARVPEGSRASMLREGRLLARVRHPNVVTVHGAQQIGDEIGVWMELITGRTLAQLVRDSGPMGHEEATVVGVSVCRALSAVHAAGLLHRDVKAQNVMRESGGRIVLMDFGAGRDAAEVIGARDYSGTPLYMAPELFRGEPATPASDIYSLGVLLFHLVSGEYPVDGRRFTDILVAHRDGRRLRLGDRRPDLDAGFIHAVERATSADPSDRPESAGAFLHELIELLPRTSAKRAAMLDADAAGNAFDRPVDVVGRAHVAAPAAARPASALLRWSSITAGVVVAIGVLGFLMSAAFDLALGREAGFSDDTPLDWWIYGARSLVAPAVYVGLAVIGVRAAIAAWDLAVSMIPALRRWHDRGRTTLTRTLERTGAGGAAAPRLLLAHIAALAFVLAFFSDIVSAVPIWVDSAPAEALAVLHPDNGKLVLYRASLTLLVFSMIMSWRALRRSGRPIDRGTSIGAVAVLALATLLLEVPWRLIYKSDFERVEYAGARCYETGRRDRDMLLFCPDAAPPRNLVRAIDDPLANRTGDWDNIFGPAR